MGDLENLCTSYDKLVKWGITIHVGIDGGSHFVLWVHVQQTNEKKQSMKDILLPLQNTNTL
jgi:hypothetical protein